MILGIDPGSKHCGVVALSTGGKVLFQAELTPGDLFEALESMPKGKAIVAIEKFQLYPWARKVKTWSSFPEVETIGVVKRIAQEKGFRVVEVPASSHKLFKHAFHELGMENPHVQDAYSVAMWVFRFKR